MARTIVKAKVIEDVSRSEGYLITDGGLPAEDIVYCLLALIEGHSWDVAEVMTEPMTEKQRAAELMEIIQDAIWDQLSKDYYVGLDNDGDNCIGIWKWEDAANDQSA